MGILTDKHEMDIISEFKTTQHFHNCWQISVSGFFVLCKSTIVLCCLDNNISSLAKAYFKSVAHLFFGTVATDHPGGQFHGVVLVFIMAHITRVRPSTARKPEGSRWHKAFTMCSSQSFHVRRVK